MSFTTPQLQAGVAAPIFTWGAQDSRCTAWYKENLYTPSNIKIGIVEQFNVGLYSARVSDISDGEEYVCLIGTHNVTPEFGFSDATLLQEADEVLFVTGASKDDFGYILAKKPSFTAEDTTHATQVKSDTKLERRTSFLSSECFRPQSPAYSVPVDNPQDASTYICANNRPTDLVPGEYAVLNQHRCGMLGGMYSASLVGGGSQIKLFALENRIRIIADSIIKHTLSGNTFDWHNRRYLSKESATCLYQEERLGLSSKDQPAFETNKDYEKDKYFTKNKAPKQTAAPRVGEHIGYYGNLATRYCMRPDMQDSPRKMGEKYIDPGVARESIDPSGQYRLATTGMLGFERIGRIPIPVRIRNPWEKEAKEPESTALKPFEHDTSAPGNRQLELADRVAYDLKNSYARLDEATSEFYTPEESELAGKLNDQYDPGFTGSSTVKLTQFDKRRSGIWQGEDGSIILRDAWGSEIVMLGGNIQLSCAGNIEILPGKTALVLAGDDIVNKAYNSVDIEAANKDVHISSFKNTQLLAGANDDHPGGITLETRGKAYPWGQEVEGGESLQTTGIFLKSTEGNIITEAKNMVLRSTKNTTLISGEEEIKDGKGSIRMSAGAVSVYGDRISQLTNDSALYLDRSATLVGQNAYLAGVSSAGVFKKDEMLVPLTWAAGEQEVAKSILEGAAKEVEFLTDEAIVTLGYTKEKLELMTFKFRSSQECGTETSWELGVLEGNSEFTLYQPFWVQVRTKFETLKGAQIQDFKIEKDLWGENTGAPWPGKKAIDSGKYAELASGVQNMAPDGLNKDRKHIVANNSPIVKKQIFPNYQIRK